MLIAPLNSWQRGSASITAAQMPEVRWHKKKKKKKGSQADDDDDDPWPKATVAPQRKKNNKHSFPQMPRFAASALDTVGVQLQ